VNQVEKYYIPQPEVSMLRSTVMLVRIVLAGLAGAVLLTAQTSPDDLLPGAHFKRFRAMAAAHTANDAESNNGGANWGGAAVDPSRGILVVVSTARRSSGTGRQGVQEHRDAIPQGGSGGDGRRADLHRDEGSQGARVALESIPALYEIGGKQYSVFCVAAQVGLTPATQVPIPGAYVAFALPEGSRQ
jgi:hypothetical protein